MRSRRVRWRCPSTSTFEGSYQDLHAAIRAELSRTQPPNLMLMGTAAPALAREQPFRV